jgi:hypothetical protein
MARSRLHADRLRRRRGGRPRLPPAARRRVQVNVWLTAAEEAILEERARATGLALSVYVRTAALAIRTAPLSEIPRSNLAVVSQLQRLGNNLNQLTRLANSGLLDPALVPVLNDIAMKLQLFHRALVGLADPDDWKT